MPDDAIHAVRNEGVGGMNAQLEREARAKGMETVDSEEAPYQNEKRANEKGGGQFSKVRGECGGGERVEERAGEVGRTVSAQGKEDRALEERPEPYHRLQQ